MSYKTIVIHLNDERRVAGLIDAATNIGQRFNAHVIALYVMPPIPVYGPNAFGAGYIEAGLRTFRDEADRVRKAFEDASRGRSIVPEWRLTEPGGRSVVDCVIEEARCADLIIAGQRDSSFDFSGVLDVPERIIIESGRPVLMIPHSGRFPTIGERVTIAWNGRREATRAVFDALPLLTEAQRVRIVWVNPQSEREMAGDVPGAAIAETLARHDVKCEVSSTTSSEVGVGDILLSGVSDDSSDLLVMGAWGHSRMREFVFGGATRDILEHMTVPVLLSH
ncbi:MAG: universal stress protein [Hyphomicrobiaceae bacterium]